MEEERKRDVKVRQSEPQCQIYKEGNFPEDTAFSQWPEFS
jgi:hypothetical protein